MNFEDVFIRVARKNKILFHKDSESIKHLHSELQSCNRKIVILWAFECAKEIVKELEEQFLNESSPRECIELCEKWASGEIKMKKAKQAILDLHTQAKEYNELYIQMYFHAIAQACSCVHTPKHALGLPMYELSAMVYKFGNDEFSSKATNKIKDYENRLAYWKENFKNEKTNWASFIEGEGYE